MTQYIDKSALVAEIWKIRNKHFNFGESPSSEYCHEDDEILGIINTLEVKEMEDSTAADMAEEIIVNLKRVENDYHIDLTKQMEWLRDIVKKGKEV